MTETPCKPAETAKLCRADLTPSSPDAVLRLLNSIPTKEGIRTSINCLAMLEVEHLAMSRAHELQAGSQSVKARMLVHVIALDLLPYLEQPD